METRKIVRANGAGVFFGEIKEKDGDRVVMTNARQLWYWNGAASLSQLAQTGTVSPDSCRFPVAVDEVEIFNVIEILSVTEEAAKTIDSVKIWKVENFSDKGSLTVAELFKWHGLLTGSCTFGRQQFQKENDLKDSDKLTLEQFVKLTQNAYGGEKIKELMNG